MDWHLIHSATASGSALKLVACERCQSECVYRLGRTSFARVQGEVFVDSEEDAELAASHAEELLEETLEGAIDPVPCPVCGWYQEDMVVEARKRHRYWMAFMGGCLLFGIIPFFIVC